MRESNLMWRGENNNTNINSLRGDNRSALQNKQNNNIILRRRASNGSELSNINSNGGGKPYNEQIDFGGTGETGLALPQIT